MKHRYIYLIIIVVVVIFLPLFFLAVKTSDKTINTGKIVPSYSQQNISADIPKVFQGNIKTFSPERIVSIDSTNNTFIVNYESRQEPYLIETEFQVVSETTVKKENDILEFNDLRVNDVVWIRATELDVNKFVAQHVIVTSDWRSSQMIIKEVKKDINQIIAEVFLPTHRRDDLVTLDVISETEIRKGTAEEGQNRPIVDIDDLSEGDIASVFEIGFGVHPRNDSGPFYTTKIDVVSPYYCQQYLQPPGCVER